MGDHSAECKNDFWCPTTFRGMTPNRTGLETRAHPRTGKSIPQNGSRKQQKNHIKHSALARAKPVRSGRSYCSEEPMCMCFNTTPPRPETLEPAAAGRSAWTLCMDPLPRKATEFGAYLCAERSQAPPDAETLDLWEMIKGPPPKPPPQERRWAK